MNIKILPLIFMAAAFGSCNTAYKSGQTPDDLYYSPARVVEEDTRREEEKEETVKNESAEDREIRMKIRDRRWRDLDNRYDCNCSCDYHPYKYGYGYGYYYNPYYYPYPVYTPGSIYTNPVKAPARTASLSGYSTTTTTSAINPKTGKREYTTRPSTYNNTNRTTTREVFSPATSNRTYTPSSSSSSSGSSSGRSVGRPTRN